MMDITINLNDFDVEDRKTIIGNIKDSDVLTKLAEDDDIYVRIAVIENPYTSKETLIKLAKEALTKLVENSHCNGGEVATKAPCVISENLNKVESCEENVEPLTDREMWGEEQTWHIYDNIDDAAKRSGKFEYVNGHWRPKGNTYP